LAYTSPCVGKISWNPYRKTHGFPFLKLPNLDIRAQGYPSPPQTEHNATPAFGLFNLNFLMNERLTSKRPKWKLGNPSRQPKYLEALSPFTYEKSINLLFISKWV
jgi:hypothetical protein